MKNISYLEPLCKKLKINYEQKSGGESQGIKMVKTHVINDHETSRVLPQMDIDITVKTSSPSKEG